MSGQEWRPITRRIGYGFVAVVCAAIVLAAGLWLADTTPSDLRREFRVASGLPKNWKTHFYEDAAVHARVACPDPASDPIVIVTGGQSNAANSLGPILDVIGNARNAQVFGERCYALESPVLGATSNAIAVWPKLGDLLERETGRPVVFINGAVGGSQIGDFIDHRSGYLARLTNRIGEANALGLEPDIAIWIQGTTDASTGMDPDRYLADQKKVIAGIESAVSGKAALDWVIPLNTVCDGWIGNGPAIERKLSEFTSLPGDRVHLGPRMSDYGPELYRDDCHLNLAGRNRLARDLLSTLLPILNARAAQEDGAQPGISPKG